MEWADVKTLDDLRQMEAPLADEFVGKSKDFFLPESLRVYWEVERKPYTPEVLVLRPNKPVSRAWDALLRIVLSRIAPLGWEPAPYYLAPQEGPPAVGPRYPVIELPDKDRSKSREAVVAINAATRVANEVTPEAAMLCDREHEELARDLGLDRPRAGFA